MFIITFVYKNVGGNSRSYFFAKMLEFILVFIAFNLNL